MSPSKAIAEGSGTAEGVGAGMATSLDADPERITCVPAVGSVVGKSYSTKAMPLFGFVGRNIDQASVKNPQGE